jgi:hypothetical protein
MSGICFYRNVLPKPPLQPPAKLAVEAGGAATTRARTLGGDLPPWPPNYLWGLLELIPSPPSSKLSMLSMVRQIREIFWLGGELSEKIDFRPRIMLIY